MHKSRIRIWEASLLIAVCVCLCQAAAESGRQAALAEKILRMHVVAASDEGEAQALKIRVRDAVAPILEEALEGCSGRDEAEARIEKSRCAILAAAHRAAEGERVEMSLGREKFPYRESESCALPAGEYSTLRLTIGEGAGHNWWGVIFPALDLSGGYLEAGEYFSEGELKLIYGGEAVEVRFRLAEILEKLKAWLSGA